MPTWKIRITADTAEEAEAMRQALITLLPGLTCRKARPGSNPKYEGQQKYLAYGEISITVDGLKLLTAPTRPARPVKAAAKRTAKITPDELRRAGAQANRKVINSKGTQYEETVFRLNGQTYVFRRVNGSNDPWQQIQ